MPIVADAAVAVRGDLTPFKKDLMGADKQVAGMGARLKGLLSPKALMLGAAGALAGSEVFQLFDQAVEDASNLEQSIGAVDSVLGPAGGKLEAFGETAADTFGLSRREVNQFGSVLAAQLKGMGFEVDDAADKVIDLESRAADMAATFGGTTGEAVQAISALLRGERDTIEKYGVSLKEADVQARILALGLDTSTVQAQKNATAIASLDLLMEATADTQGQFARESDSLAGAQARQRAELENARAELGDKLMPIWLAFTNLMTDVGVPALQLVADVVGMVVGGIQNLAGAFQEAAGDVNFFAMNFGDQGDRVHQIADDFGVDFDELKDRIRDRMLETGESFTDAADHIESEMKRARDEAGAASWEMMQGILSAAAEGNKQLKVEAHRMAAVVPDEIRARWKDVRDAAFQTAVEHAKGILDGQNQVKVAFEVLTQLQEEEQTRAQRIAYLQGLLSSQELKDGLNDGRDGVRGAANATRAAIVAELASLGVDAYNSGWAVSREIARGIYASAHLADGATSYLAAKISNKLPRSEPKEGPLRGITKVGHAIVSSITDGIYASIGSADQAATALAGALLPSLGVPALATGTAAAEAGAFGGTGNTYILNANGVERVFNSRDDFMQALDDLGAFGEGRL